jgi:hypothetical protein
MDLEAQLSEEIIDLTKLDLLTTTMTMKCLPAGRRLVGKEL